MAGTESRRPTSLFVLAHLADQAGGSLARSAGALGIIDRIQLGCPD